MCVVKNNCWTSKGSPVTGLADWKHFRTQIAEEDPSCTMDDETPQTLLMKTIPDDQGDLQLGMV